MKYKLIINYKGEMIESQMSTRKKNIAEEMQNKLVALFGLPVGLIYISEKGDNNNGRKKKTI